MFYGCKIWPSYIYITHELVSSLHNLFDGGIQKWLKIHDIHVMQMVLNVMANDNMDHFNYSYYVILN
jgi:hypothetical protein